MGSTVKIVSVFISAMVISVSAQYHEFADVRDDCTGDLPNYHFYPYDCKKYYGCESGELKLYTCENDLYWNEEVKACDIHEKTNCSNIIPFPDPDCSDGTNQYYLYPYDCSKFWECYETKLYLMTCPARSLWNDKEKDCDEKDVDCSHIIPYPATTVLPPTQPITTTSTTTTTTTTPAPTTTLGPIPTFLPPECTYDNTYYPYPYDCSKYYECSNGQPHIMKCKETLVWNDAAKTCDYPYNVDCSFVVTTVTPK